MYISKTIQNELIKCYGEEIFNKVIKNVKKDGIYSIIFDETTDIAHQSKIIFECGIFVWFWGKRRFIEFINIREVAKSTKYDKKAIFQEAVVTRQNIGSVVLEMLIRHSV